MMVNWDRRLVRLLSATLMGYIAWSGGMLAQDGRWVHYPLEGIGAGANYLDCGDGVIGYAPINSQYVLIFDIGLGEWMPVDLGTAQTFDYLETKGNVLIARSGDLLLGYSSSLGIWDTIHFEGTVLMDISSPLYESYGCSDSLAFYVTDQKFYVFDGALGYWQQYDYGLPEDYGSGYFHCKDDYILLVLLKTDFYAGIVNVVYSSHTRSFNKLENGCIMNHSKFDHGFAGLYDKTGDGKDFLIVGYSALDNQFDVIPYVTGEHESLVDFYDVGTMEADSFIAYACGFRTVVTPYELVRVKFYGFSTMLGTWNTVSYDVDWEAERYYGNGQLGGQFTLDLSTEPEVAKYRFYFYSAGNGLFHKIHTDLVYTSTTSAIQVGGEVLCVFDADNGWGYNPIQHLGNGIELLHDHTANFLAADDYATFCRWSQGADMMRMYVYNSRTNNWSWIDTHAHWDQTGTGSAHIYLYKAWPENNIIVYSSCQDTILRRDLPDSIFVYTASEGILVSARSENRSLLFNTERCTVHEKHFEFNQKGMGTRSAAFYDTTGSRVLHGYSSLSDQWTTHTISDQPYYCYDPGYIGLISARVGMNEYGKFYAYNGLADSWVELIPEGKSVGHRVGNRTAVVIRSGHIYAFDPYTPTAIDEEGFDKLPPGLILHQNYPNPFHAFTTIRYELAEATEVVLSIYNNLGQEVRILVDEHQTAGAWSVPWDGRNGNNQPVPSGIYIYHIKAGDEIKSQIMFLLNENR